MGAIYGPRGPYGRWTFLQNLLEICSQVAHLTGLVHHRTENKDGYSRILTEAFQVGLAPDWSSLAPDYHMSVAC
jgi:myo-inositol catabolism protein IolC